jgi:hypothetical protein
MQENSSAGLGSTSEPQYPRLAQMRSATMSAVLPHLGEQWHRVLVGCAAASMRYHDEVRVFSRLMANSVVGDNQ